MNALHNNEIMFMPFQHGSFFLGAPLFFVSKPNVTESFFSNVQHLGLRGAEGDRVDDGLWRECGELGSVREQVIALARYHRRLDAGGERALAPIVDQQLVSGRGGDLDKEPFIQATEPVRQKFGGKYSELIKRIQAVK